MPVRSKEQHIILSIFIKYGVVPAVLRSLGSCSTRLRNIYVLIANYASLEYLDRRGAAATPALASVQPNWDNTFKAPFEEFENKKRVVEGWNTFGDTAVKQNFIRLTPDRQSKVGYMVNKEPVETPNFFGAHAVSHLWAG